MFLVQALLTGAHAATTPKQAHQTAVRRFIQNLGDRGIDVLVDTNLTPAQLDAEYSQMLNSSFDTETIGTYVFGEAWEQTTSQQRKEYLTLFKQYLIKIYGNRLRPYDGEDIYVSKVIEQNEQDIAVGTLIVHPNGATTSVDWIVRKTNDGKFAVVDVIIDGVSQSKTQQAAFASVFSRNGGDIDMLLKALRQNVGKGLSDDGIAK